MNCTLCEIRPATEFLNDRDIGPQCAQCSYAGWEKLFVDVTVVAERYQATGKIDGSGVGRRNVGGLKMPKRRRRGPRRGSMTTTQISVRGRM